MSLSGSIGSPTKECSNGSQESLPRDFSRLSLFSAGSTISQDEHFQCEGHADHSLSCMKKYLQAGKLCDVMLIAGNGGKKVQAHKLVLSAASEYFAAMFTGGLSNNEQTEITLGDVNGDVLQAVVNYCYTGTIEIREDNVETLLATACLMLLGEVADACARFLARQLHPSNCLGIAAFAEHQACAALARDAQAYTSQHFMQVADACARFLARQLHPSNCLGIAAFAEHQACAALARDAQAYTSQHFMQVVKNQEFLQLNADQLTSLLTSEELNVPREEHVFRALMAWVQHDPPSRRQHVAHLLGLIKLPCLRPQYLCDHVEPAVGDDPACQRLVMDAMKWHLLPERRTQMACARTRPRKATLGRLLVVGGMDLNKGATTIESYCPRTDVWSVAHHMSGRRLQFGIALLQDKLLVVGGRDGLKTLNTMECLDLEAGTWTQLSPMNTHRHGLGVAVLGGTLYAVGGHDGWSYLNTVERWDPAARQWHYVAPMLNQRCSAGVAVLGGKLYAVGGRDGAACLRSVECYDPHTNKWTLVASLARRNGCMGVAVSNGLLYVLGGQDAPANNPSASRFDCVDRYDPSSDAWSTVGQLPSKRDALSSCLFGDRIYAVGGYDGATYLKNVESFDPVANEWVALAPLRAGRAGACVIAVGHRGGE